MLKLKLKVANTTVTALLLLLSGELFFLVLLEQAFKIQPPMLELMTKDLTKSRKSLHVPQHYGICRLEQTTAAQLIAVVHLTELLE